MDRLALVLQVWRQPVRQFLLLALALSTGCAAPLMTGFLGGSQTQEALPDDQLKSRRAVGKEPAAATAASSSAANSKTEDQAMAEVLNELKKISAIDPATEQQVLAELREAKPADYPMIVETFQTALAYRRQLAEREATEAEQSEQALAESGPLREFSPRSLDDRRAAPREAGLSRLAASAEDDDRALGEDMPTAEYRRGHATRGDARPKSVATANRSDSADPPLTPESSTVGSTVEPEGTAIVSDDRDGPITTASHVEPIKPTTLSKSGDWHAELDASIASLERTVNPTPGSVDEIHDHMRLRALLLLAGRAEEAYRPIPGTSPAQQDYWSKQLFAMAAYLDGAAKLDDKQRAAAALAPLDEARAKLAHLATLQIRNMILVQSVDGFGSYEPRKPGPFLPGDALSIYAEVENFRSTSTEAGYQTALGSSYQLVDESGRRIDGNQFPDVEDVCRNRRRDFHMHYGNIALPKNLTPGAYRLELTVTDHASGKIGHASLPLEIAPGR